MAELLGVLQNKTILTLFLNINPASLGFFIYGII